MKPMDLAPSKVKELVKSGRMTIGVIGLGHVGLPLALLFVSLGAKVIGCEVNSEYLSKLKHGVSPIVEHSGSRLGKTVTEHSCPNCGVRLLEEKELFCPNCFRVAEIKKGTVRLTGSAHKVGAKDRGDNEMASLLKTALASKRFILTSDSREAAANSDILIIAVGTPIDSTLRPDLRALESATSSLGAGIKRGSIVILKSTVPPGTTEDLVRPILEKDSGMRAGKDFGLAHVPETTLEGLALIGYRTLPKTIGGVDSRSAQVAAAVFEVLGAAVYVFDSPRVTETAKLFQNIYRDVNIALANELALASEALGVDSARVTEAALTEPKTHLLTPGPGVGGYCLTKDSYYLISPASEKGFVPEILTTARKKNDEMPSHVVALVVSALKEKGIRATGAKVAVLGVAFKANTADTRDSPALKVVTLLAGLGASIRVHDPLADLPNLDLPEGVMLRSSDLKKVLSEANVVVLTTDHIEYRGLGEPALRSLAPKLSAVIDTRNVFDPARIKQLGLAYRGVGRGGF
ncbi:MAG TPA: nucleotide sugar dehydrogenase [Nitrososphaerales archaeon]|nr:nucleotide sugar dehydrogenase [Nitrososphaerales archaeon]